MNDHDAAALTITVGHATRLIENGTTAEWNALTDALFSEHTPEQLANMLTGACTLLAIAGRK